MIQLLPFATKELSNGKKLYRRKHGYLHSCTIGTSSTTITVPYNSAKINEIELVGMTGLTQCNFKVLDSTTGLVTGIPNTPLNQFGFNVCVPKDFYSDISPYDADVYLGLQLVLEVTSTAEFILGINITFHEII